MANQIIIDIGAVANDGTGDPLRTAFGYVNDNFSNVWATGVANANIGFSGNKILTVNTNGNLVLAPNGTGKVVANVDIVPNMANVRNLGAINNRWSTVYSQYLNVTNDVDFTGDVTVGGNLTVTGNTIQIGNITTETKTIQLANSASTANAANGSGVTVGANDNIATMLYNSTSNTWVMNIGANITGNVTAPYFIGNGSQLTGINTSPAGSNTQIQFNDGGVFGADADFYFRKTTNTLVVNGGLNEHSVELGSTGFTDLNSNVIAQITGNANSYTQVNFQNINSGTRATTDYIATAAFGTDSTYFVDMGIASNSYDNTNPENSLGNALYAQDSYLYSMGANNYGGSGGNLVVGSNEPGGVVRVIADGSFTSNIVATFSNVGIDVKGNVVPVTSNVYNLGSPTHQWNDLYVSNATIYMNSVPISLGAGNILTVNGEAVLSNDSNASITTTGNITADYFIGDGSQLTGLPDGTAITNGTSQIDIPVANGNIYVGVNNVGSTEFTALGINTLDLAALGNVTADGTVQGNVVTADTAINTAGTIAATGNIEGGNINTDGMITATNQVYAQYFTLKGGGAPGTSIGNLGYGGNIVELQGTAGVNIVTTGDEGGPTWQFDTTGDLTVPNYVKFAGNTFIGDEPSAGTPYFRIDTPLGYPATITTDTDISGNNWAWTFGADGVLTTPGDITGPGSLEIQAAPNGNAYVNLDDISDSYIGAAANLYLLANSDNREWIFDTSGTLTTPGDITVGGDITGRASANTLVLKAQPTTDTYIQLNSIVDSTIQTFANLDIVTDSSNTSQTFTFGTDGSLSVPGNITTTANISGGYVLGNAAFMTGIPASYGNANVADFLDSLGSNAIVTTGNISGGNLLASGYANITGNINGSGATFSGNVTAANFSGNISITGNVTGTSPNVSLVAGSYTYTFDNTGVLSLPAVGGDEGGEINFAIPTANTTLTGPVKVDVYQDRLRFFDGSTNGAYLDLANCPSGVSAAIGYRDIPQISFSANATATGNAAGCHYYSTTAGTLQLTIPDNANVAFPTGATLTIVVNAAGNVIVAQGTGVSLYMAGSSSTGNRTVGAYGLASVMKVATNTWVISGTGVY